MKDIYVKTIAERLGIKDWQVENCVHLLEEGGTIPFISRYRKEKTGGLDDVSVAEIKHWRDVYEEMEKRKEGILSTIEGLGKLTPELRSKIEACTVSSELEDLYLPYRPKRRTRATVAVENGLEPLADKMWNGILANPEQEARKYLNGKVEDVDAALAGARDIVAERISETALIRDNLRQIFRTRRIETAVTKKASANEEEARKYRAHFNVSVPLQRVPAHVLLAVLRAENEGFLSVSLDADPEKCGKKIFYDFCQEHRRPGPALAGQIQMAIDDAFKRLLRPSLTNEIIKEAKEKADLESIAVFGENLSQLLLSAPVGQKRTMAIDPGFRNGCKIAVLNERGELLHHTVIFPHPPQNQKVKSIMEVSDIIEKYGVEVIAIGNGTASRETEDFIRKVGCPDEVKVYTVSEDGASIYSASEVAREEFPDEDVTVRGAVSIGRRLMDPLSELVKIDPKSLGVGQYQHDVDQNLLREKLDNTVVSCVNAVGVNLNTASPYLLSYVSGIGPSLAKEIVSYRNSSGGFASRSELRKVPKLGPKTFEQCAGFLRVQGAENPLDNSAVHPESYYIVDKMAADLGISAKELIGNQEMISKINPADYVEGDFGLPTINDILRELAKPGRDPREAASEFAFADDVREIDDLKPGMELPGIVTNITAFGAFVDIGIHENGLVHISKFRGRKLKLHQHIKVSVLSVELDRKRISLDLIG